MPAENVAITGSFIPNTDTPYKVEHYLEDLTKGSYTLIKTDNLTGTTDTEVQARAKGNLSNPKTDDIMHKFN